MTHIHVGRLGHLCHLDRLGLLGRHSRGLGRSHRDRGVGAAMDRSWCPRQQRMGPFKDVSERQMKPNVKNHLRNWGSWRSGGLRERILVSLGHLPGTLLGLRVGPVFAAAICGVFLPGLICESAL